jgi:hypothetical protein
VVSGNIAGNTTWTIGGSPYIIEKLTVEVKNGSTLTIDPGVEIRFAPNTRIVTVAPGSVVAVGAPGDTIVFTSNSGTPTPGDWNSVGIFSSPSSSFERCRFEYAANALYISYSDPPVRKCTFRHCNIALYLTHASPKVMECWFEPPVQYSVLSNFSDSLPTFSHCNFKANRAINIRLEQYSTFAEIVAEFNWWGTTNTVFIANTIVDALDGHGQGVVDYAPWLAEVPVEVTTWGRIKALFRD